MKKVIAVALCGLLFAVGLFADTTNVLPRIVVTATRASDEVRRVPSNPSVVTSGQIADGHYTSLPDALEDLAGVQFNRLIDNPTRAGVNLRGFGGDNPHGKVLILLNGHRLNRPDQATVNWAQIPLSTVDRVEVVRGANTALYGDHAVGGVINIITREGNEEPSTTMGVTVGSYQFHEEQLATSGQLDGLNYSASLGHQSGDGYRDRSSFDTVSGSLCLSGMLTDNLQAYTDVSLVKEQHQLPAGLSKAQIEANRRAAGNPNDAAREVYVNALTGLEFIPSEDWVFSLDGGFSRKEIRADFPSYGAINGFSDNDINSWSLLPKVTLLKPLGGLGNRLTVGADLLRDDLHVDRYNDPARRNHQGTADISKQSIELYVHDSLSLLDEKLILSAGIRQGDSRIDVESSSKAYAPWFIAASAFDDAKRHREEAYHLGAVLLAVDSLKLFARFDKIYRYPFTDEQANYFGWGSDLFNTNMVPEKGISYEAGAEWTPVSNLVLQATLFKTDMEDEIAFVGWPVNSNVNMDETVHQGVELSAKVRNKLFAADLFYTWMQSEFTAGADDGKSVPWVPENRLDITLSFFLTDALTVGSHMQFVGSMIPQGDTSNASTEGQADYAVFDLMIDYLLPIRSVDARLFARIDNVFETEYSYLITDYGTGGYYYPAPERTWQAGVNVTF